MLSPARHAFIRAISARRRSCRFCEQLLQPPVAFVKKMSFLPNKHGIVFVNAVSFSIEKIRLSSITTRSRMVMVPVELG